MQQTATGDLKVQGVSADGAGQIQGARGLGPLHGGEGVNARDGGGATRAARANVDGGLIHCTLVGLDERHKASIQSQRLGAGTNATRIDRQSARTHGDVGRVGGRCICHIATGLDGHRAISALQADQGNVATRA